MEGAMENGIMLKDQKIHDMLLFVDITTAFNGGVLVWNIN
jgi:hypothetical protein